MKPSELKNVSKLMEKRKQVTEDLSMFLATSQVGVLHMRHPHTFETNYDAELWKDQCNKLLNDITVKTSELKEYLNDDSGGETNSKSNRPSLSLKLISRHYTDDDMDHLNPGCVNEFNTKDSILKTPSNISDNEQIEEVNKSIFTNGNVSEDSTELINEDVVKQQLPIANQTILQHKDDDLIELLQNISDISDNDLEFSDITLGSELDEKPEYSKNRKRKKIAKKKCEDNSQHFKRACFVNLIRFDTNLYKEYVAKHKKYKLSDLTEFLKLTKKRKRSISSSDRSLDNNSPVYYPDSDTTSCPATFVDATDEPLLDAYEQVLVNTEEDMIAAMNQISDSDMSGLDSDVDSDSDSNTKNKNKVKKTKKKKKIKTDSDSDSDFEPEIIRPSNSSWRRDPLLLENLDFDENKTDKNKCDFIKSEEKENVSEAAKPSSREDTPDIFEQVDSDFVPVDDNSTDTIDSDVECLGNVTVSPGKGRRNIRPMLHDEALHEATQKANKIELEKQKRLEELKNSVSSFVLSQSSNSEIDGLLLDVDKVSMKPIVVVNTNLTKRLKTHQQEGVKFMWNACFERLERISKHEGSGCILAHCMGLGKTFQVATLVHTLFAYPDTEIKHVLIICPLSTVPNWKQEFLLTKRVAECGAFNLFYKTRTTANVRTVVMHWRKQGGVLILGYDAFHSLLTRKKTTILSHISESLEEALRDPGPDLLVCDEGHLLKNQNKKKYKSINMIKTKRRIILTGTPMQNNLTEYYYMVQLIKPSLLGTFKEFTNRFNNPITNGQYGDSTSRDIKIMKQRSHVLHNILKGTVQRYEESELNIYLPPKVDYALYIQMNEVQASLYLDVLNKLRSGRGQGEKASEFISHYQQLMPFWMHPCISYTKENNKKRVEYETITIDNEHEDVVIDLTPDLEDKFPADVEANINYGAKFVIIMAIIEECLKLDDRLLIFSTSLFILDAIEKFLKFANKQTEFQWIKNKTYFRLDGQVLPIDRVDITDKFNDKNSRAKLMLMTNKVGGLGLNLVAANRVLLADISWNPALDTQSVFRSYRFGQEKPVYIYRLIARGTMEETVYRRAVTKVAIAGRVVDEQQIDRHYKSVDLQEIYRFYYNKDEVRPIPKVPTDNLLATLLQSFPAHIFGYDEHNSLFLNRPDEELNEEEMKEAWAEYNKERQPKPPPPPPPPQIGPINVPLSVDLLKSASLNRYLDYFLPPLVNNISAEFLVNFAKNSAALSNNINTNTPIKQGAIALQSAISRFSSASGIAKLNETLPPNASGAVTIKETMKNLSQAPWLSKPNRSMPMLHPNILKKHRAENGIMSQKIANPSTPIRINTILPKVNMPSLASPTIQAVYSSNNNNNSVINVTDQIGSAIGSNVVNPLDMSLGDAHIVTTDIRTGNLTTTEPINISDSTAPAELEDFVVNPFLPTEIAEVDLPSAIELDPLQNEV